MADLSIVTWTDASEVALGDPLEFLTLTIGVSSAQSSALISPDSNSKRRLRVRLFANADCFILWGSNPTASDFTDSIPLGANNPEYFEIESGNKIAVIERV